MVDIVAPQVCESLQMDVFPDFRRFFSEACEQADDVSDDQTLRFIAFLHRSGQRYGEDISYSMLLELASAMPSAAYLLASLSTWAGRFRLGDAWFLDIALWTLYQWQEARLNGLGGAVGQWFFPFVELQPRPENPGFVFRVGGPAFLPSPDGIRHRSREASYDPVIETRSSAKDRLLGAFEERLTAYFDEVEEETGLPKSSSRGLRQFDWLIRYQCLGESMIRIAASGHLSRETVSEPIHALADLLQLDLRPPKPGKPSDGEHNKRQTAGQA